MFPSHNLAEASRRLHAWTSSPFHNALLSSKTCGFLHHANLDIRITQCLTSFSCQRSFPDPVTIGISAPGGAQCRFGAATAINSFANKKPGNKRRASPSISCGCFYPRSLQNGYARCSFFSYPVLVSNLTSCRVGRSGPSGDSPTNQGSANNKGVYQIFGIRQALFTIYLSAYPPPPVNFSAPVEIQPNRSRLPTQDIVTFAQVCLIQISHQGESGVDSNLR